MKKRILLSFLTTASMIPVFVHGSVDEPINFTKAVISEVINDVRVVDAKSLAAKPAAKDETFLAPNMLRTGRKSRAQLLMPDGTVVRVGSNAVFSFDAAARTIRLQSGTVIFHSPTGKGGGTIVTNSATASVIGTTIMVTATSNGGFKFSVLEGVGKVSFPGGKESQIKAGQMTFVLPKAGDSSEDGSSEESKDEEGGAAVQGIVLNFDLATMVSESGLLNGFSSAIASASKIQSAVGEQGSKIAGGDLQQTGMVILNAATSQDFYCADLASVRQQSMASDMNFALSQNTDMRVAADLQENLYVDQNNRIPDRYIFREPVAVAGAGWGFNDFTGVLAKEVTFGSGTVDLSKVDGAPEIGIGAQKIVFEGNIVLSGLNRTEVLIVGGGEIVNRNGASLNVVFGGEGGALRLIAESTSELAGMTVSNNTGSVAFQVNSGDLVISNSALESQNTISGSSIAGDMTLVSSTGAVEINSSDVAAHNSTLTVSGATDVAVNDSSLAGQNVGISGGNVSISGGSQISGDTVAVAGNGNVEINSSHLTADAGSLSISGPVQVTIDNSVLHAVDTLISGGIIGIANSTEISGSTIAINSGAGLAIAGSSLLATDGISLTGGTGSVQISQSNLSGGIGVASVSGDTGLILDGTYVSGNVVNLVSSHGDVSASSGTNIVATANGVINAANISLTDTAVSSQGELSILAKNELSLERTSIAAHDINLVSSTGGIQLNLANIQSSVGDVSISAPLGVAISNSVLGASQGNLEIISSGAVAVSSSAIISGGSFKVEGSSVDIMGSAATTTDIDLLRGTVTANATAGSLTLDRVSIASFASADVEGISLGGDTVEVSRSQIQTPTADIVITAVNGLRLTETTITGSSLVLNANPRGGVITLDQLNLNVPMQGISATAETITLSNVSFSDGTLATLYSRTGHLTDGVPAVSGDVNFVGNVTYAGNNVMEHIYLPELNIGDVGSPIHILPIGASDYRGSKLDYSLGNPLTYVTVGGIDQVSNNFVYKKVTTFTPTQLAGIVPLGLAELDPDLYKFCGVLAQSMTLSQDLMTHMLAAFHNADFTGMTVPSIKFYASSLTLDSGLTFNVPAYINHVEIGGTSLTIPDGGSVSASFGTSEDLNNRLVIRSVNSLTVSNATLNAFHGNLSIQTGQDFAMNGGTLSAGCGAPSHPNGHVSVEAPVGTVTLASVNVLGTQDDSRLTIAANQVQLSNTVMRAPAAAASYIGIQGAQSVSIQGGRLIARDIHIGGVTGPAGIRGTLENLDIDGVQFADVPPALGTGVSTVAMEARTIVIRNMDFNPGSQVTLSSGEGALNIMSTGSSKMVGAVNFGSGTVRYNGNDVTTGTGISSFVNIQDHTSTNSKIFFNGAQQTGIDVAGASAPIQIKRL